jgi:2-methylcitrate dehydratase
MRDPALRQLMQRIRISENPEFTREFPSKLMTRIEVTTRGGQRLVEMASYPRGHAKNPMSDADVESKFADLSRALLAPDRRDALLRALWDIDQASDIVKVMDLVRVN